jgi:hypothetical protein
VLNAERIKGLARHKGISAVAPKSIQLEGDFLVVFQLLTLWRLELF